MWKSILGKVTLQHKSIEKRADMQKAARTNVLLF